MNIGKQHIIEYNQKCITRFSLGTVILFLMYLILMTIGCSQNKNGRTDNIRPNILLMVADDAGWRDVGYHGSEIKTPHIDKLAASGVELDQFYVYPTCSPTRAALLTGRNPSRYGILGPIAMRSKQILPPETITLPKLLQQNGYATAITGKWHLGLRPENGPRRYGFEHTYGYLHGQIDQYTHKYKNGDRSWHRNDVFIDEEGHATDLITREAIHFIKEIRDKTKPFFLYVPFSVPHYPLQEEEKWVKPYDFIKNESRRLFAASMTHMDDAIGQLINTLKDENLQDNTLVIFISDNGGQESWTPTFEYDMEHGPNDRLGDNKPLRDWKGSLYEGGIRVPGIINWPAKLSPSRVKKVISVTDIYPTIASLAGIPVVSDLQLDGLNVWPAIAEGESLGERFFYWRTSTQLALLHGNLKLVHHHKKMDKGTFELFNLPDDPYETNNIAKEEPDSAEKLQGELKLEIDKDLTP